MSDTQQMPKKKIEEIVSKPRRPKVESLKVRTASPPARAVAPRKTAAESRLPKVVPVPVAAAQPAGPGEDLSQFPAVFENKAGHYELIRVDGGQAYYSFTNQQKRTVDATMSVVTWRKMQASAYKETA